MKLAWLRAHGGKRLLSLRRRSYSADLPQHGARDPARDRGPRHNNKTYGEGSPSPDAREYLGSIAGHPGARGAHRWAGCSECVAGDEQEHGARGDQDHGDDPERPSREWHDRFHFNPRTPLELLNPSQGRLDPPSTILVELAPRSSRSCHRTRVPFMKFAWRGPPARIS